MKWGVGKVIFDAAYLSEEERKSGVVDSYKKGINNGKLIILPYYHLNMEQILPEREDLSVISYIPGKRKEVYCVVLQHFINMLMPSLVDLLTFQTLWQGVMSD